MTQSASARFFAALIATALVFGTLIFLTFIPANKAHAAVPNIINYQGRLEDPNGNALGGSGGTNYDFIFSIWDSPAGGSRLWPASAPASTTLAVTNGVFSVDLGDTSLGFAPLNLNFNSGNPYYLQIEVWDATSSAFETLTPRQAITSEGTAINAGALNGFTQGTSSNNLLLLDSGGNINLPSGQIRTINSASCSGVSAVGGGALCYDTTNNNLFVFNAASSTWVSVGGGSAGSVTLQQAYNLGNTITTADGRDFSVTLANTTTSANFIVNIANSSNGAFEVQNNGSNNFSVNASTVIATVPTIVSSSLTVNGTTTLQGLAFTNATGNNLSVNALAAASLTTNVTSSILSSNASGVLQALGITGSGLSFSGNTLSNSGVTSLSGSGAINVSNATGSVMISFVNPGFVTAASSVVWTGLQTFAATTTFASTTLFSGYASSSGQFFISSATIPSLVDAGGNKYITSTPVSVLSLASDSSIAFSAATGSNITATFLNPQGFITTSSIVIGGEASSTFNLGLGLAISPTGTIGFATNSISQFTNDSGYLTSLTGALLAANNFADLTNTSTARTNLGFSFLAGNKLSVTTTTAGGVTYSLATSSISQFTNDSGYITTAPGTTTINQVAGPTFTFGLSSSSNAFSITTSSGNLVINLPNNLSAFVNDRGYITSSSIDLGGVQSSTFNLGTGLAISGTGTIGFATTSISQFVNDKGYITSTAGALLTSNNLSDLTSTSSARTNIGFSNGTGITISGTGAIANTGVLSVASGSEIAASSGTGSGIQFSFATTSVSQFANDAGYLTSLSGALLAANNLSDLTNTSTARTNIGLGSLANALQLIAANNLSDLTSTSSARTNIGFSGGSKITISSTGTIGLATTSISQFVNDAGYVTSTGGSGNITINQLVPTSTFNFLASGVGLSVASAAPNNIIFTLASSSYLQPLNNLSELTNTSTARTNIGFSGGGGISISATGTITNAGVISNTSGTGINVSAATGANTITLNINGGSTQNCPGSQFVSTISPTGTIQCSTPSGGGDVSSATTTINTYFPFWSGSNQLSATSSLQESGLALLAGGAFNASGTITENGVPVLTAAPGTTTINQVVGPTFTFSLASSSNAFSVTTSSGNITINLPNNLGAFANDVGYITTSSINIGGVHSSTFNIGTGLAISTTGTIGFSTTSISQFVNDKGYITSTAGALLIANNLADLASTSSARTNLGLGSGNAPTFNGLALLALPPASTSSALLALGSSTQNNPATSTFIGINATSSWVGDFLDFEVNSSSAFRVTSAGNVLANGSLNASGTITQNGVAVLTSLNGALLAANNLSDLNSTSSARTNLGLGTAATQNTGTFLQASNNLSDLTNTSTARTNIGLSFLAGSKLTVATTTTGSVTYSLSTTSISQFVNDSGYITAAPGTTTINQVVGPTFTFSLASSSNAFSVTTSSGNITINLPNNLGAFANDVGYITTSSITIGGTQSSTFNLGTGLAISGTGTIGFATTSISQFVNDKGYITSTAGALLIANNLADLASTSSARTNLGLGSGNAPTFNGLALLALPPASTSSALLALGSSTQNNPATSTFIGINATSSWVGDFLDFEVNSSSAFRVTSAGNVLAGGSLNASGTITQNGVAVLTSLNGALLAANNLSDLNSTSSARTNLGLGTAATQNTGTFLQASNNLSDLTNTSTARTNIGLSFLAGSKLTVATTTTGSVTYSLSTTSISQFVNDSGYITAAPGTTTINQVVGPTFTFSLASSSNAFSVTTSSGNITINLPNNLGAFANDVGYITTSSITIGGTQSSTFNLGTGLAISGTGTIGFATTSISQFVNDKGYITSTAGALLIANNLADLASTSSARTNLGLGSGNAPTFNGLALLALPPASTSSALLALGSSTQNNPATSTFIGINATSSWVGDFLDFEVNSSSAFRVTSAGNVLAGGSLNASGTITQNGVAVLTSLNGALLAANNLSDLTSTSSARTNIGLGNLANALQLIAANNLADLTSTSSARTNLGFTGGAKVTISSTGTIGLATTSVSQFVNDAGYITAAPGTTTINQVTGPTFTFGLASSSNAFSVTTSSGNITINLPNNLGAFANDKGYITTSSITIGGTQSSTFNLGTGLAISGTGTIGFATTSISQFVNDKGYITSTAGALLIANNLADLASTSSARTNLGLGSGNAPTFNGLALLALPPASTSSALLALGSSTQNNPATSTFIGINATSSWVGDFLDFEVNSSSAFRVTSAGNVLAGGSLNASGTITQNGVAVLTSLNGALLAANNLSDLTSTSSARTNIGLGNLANALQLIAANNLADLTSTSSARTNLGFTGGAKVTISSTGTIGLATTSVSQFVNDAGYITAAPGTTTINQVTGPTFTFGLASSSNAFSVTTSSGNITINLPNNLGAFANDVGYITTSSITIGGTQSSTFNLGTGLAISGTGTIGFATTSISQFVNDKGYITSTAGALLIANNLADLASTSSARTNLGLGSGNAPTFNGLALLALPPASTSSALLALGSSTQNNPATSTFIGINATSSWVGDFLDFEVNSSSAFRVTSTGTIIAAGNESINGNLSVLGTATLGSTTISGNVTTTNLAILSLAGTGGCLSVGSTGVIATSTCSGGGGSGLTSSTLFAANFVPLILNGNSLTQSMIQQFQNGLVIATGTGTWPVSSATASLLQLGSSTIQSGNASGTFLGINASSGFNGDFVNLQVNSTTAFDVSASGSAKIGGNLNVSGTSAFNATTSFLAAIQGGSGSSGEGMQILEGSCPSAAAGSDILCASSGAHAFQVSFNGGSYLSIPQLAGDLGGTAASPTVVGLQTYAVSSTAPSANQVLTWNGVSWTPENVSSTATGTAFYFPHWNSNGSSLSTSSLVYQSSSQLSLNGANDFLSNLESSGTVLFETQDFLNATTTLPYGTASTSLQISTTTGLSASGLVLINNVETAFYSSFTSAGTSSTLNGMIRGLFGTTKQSAAGLGQVVYAEPFASANSSSTTEETGETCTTASSCYWGTLDQAVPATARIYNNGSTYVNGALTVNGSVAGTTATFTGTSTFAGSVGVGSASTPSSTFQVTGAPSSTASSTLVQFGSNVIQSGNVSGTYLGINAVSGYNGDFLNFEVNSSSAFRVSATGTIVGGLSVSGNVTSTGITLTGIINAPCLSTNGAGVVSATACGAGSGNPGGVSTDVQYNSGGNLGGDANFTWSSSTAQLILASSSGAVVIGTTTPATGALLTVSGTAYLGGIAGAGLTNCTSTISRLTWSSATNQFACNTSSTIPAIVTNSTSTLMAITTTSSTLNLNTNFTLENASDSVLVTYNFNIIGTGTAASGTLFIFRGIHGTSADTLIATSSITNNAVNLQQLYSLTYVDAPATTTAQIYSFYALANTATHISFNKQTLVLQEVKIGSDLAEIYPTDDSSIQPGDVVALDPNSSGGVVLTSGAYDPNVIGIVSTNPGLIIGDAPPGNVALVALSGRVPVNVSGENGDINPGDYLAPSSIPGVAMKATKAGNVIGQAMSSFSGSGQGTVLAFVKNGYFGGIMPTSEVSSSTSSSTTLAEDTGVQLLEDLLSGEATIASSSDVSQISTDRLAVGLEVVTPSVVTNNFSAQNSAAVGGDETIGGNLTLNGGFSIVGVASGTASSTPAISFDSLGDATFAGNVSATAISANDIESPGLTAIIDNIANISSTVAQLSSSTAALASSTASTTASFNAQLASLEGQIITLQSSTASVDFSNLLNASGTLSLNGALVVNGGLQVNSISSADGGDVSFNNDVVFFGRPYLNNDSGGFAIIAQGQDQVNITFNEAYVDQPVVNATIALDASDTAASAQTIFADGVSYLVTNESTTGFTIMLNKPAPAGITFDWIALAVQNAETFTLTSPNTQNTSSTAPANASSSASSTQASSTSDQSASSSTDQNASSTTISSVASTTTASDTASTSISSTTTQSTNTTTTIIPSSTSPDASSSKAAIVTPTSSTPSISAPVSTPATATPSTTIVMIATSTPATTNTDDSNSTPATADATGTTNTATPPTPSTDNSVSVSTSTAGD